MAGSLRMMQRHIVRLAAAGVVAASLLVGVPAASAANLQLNVTFSATGQITLTFPDGTPVGVTSGTPTVIPAGFYTMNLIGPGGCSTLPYFDLRGPGNNILDNMDQGEEANKTDNATFLPNSTYTWRDDQNPSVVYTFVTDSEVLGSAPTTAVSPTHGTAVSQDPFASGGTASLRGTLVGAISPAGKLSLAFDGRSVTSLAAGRYTLKIDDRSASNGFLIEKANHKAVSYSGVIFVGSRTDSLRLTSGTWLFMPKLGQTAYTIAVH
jgi:hypothetical protein